MLEQAVARIEPLCERITRDARQRGNHHLTAELMQRMRHATETVAATLPLRRDDGSLLLVPAWRCRYSDLLGPTKGGIRFHESVSMEEVMALGFWMTLKCALLGLPFGGGKGGAQVDVSSLSQMELERLSRLYVRAFANVIHPERDIPAPDIATGGKPIAWMADEYLRITGRHTPEVFTGKPLPLGGIPGRPEATGDGAAHVLAAVLQKAGKKAEDLTFAVQGFGSAGKQIARRIAAMGGRIIAMADSKATVHDDGGLDLGELEAWRESHDHFTGFDQKRRKERDAILQTGADVFVPAALGGVIGKAEAKSMKAGMIVELANGPVRPEADEILRNRGIVVVPDILANAGGVFVSWLEWQQNRMGLRYDRDHVAEALEKAMRSATEEMFAHSTDETDYRSAAYEVALRRLGEVIEARGTRDIFAKG